PSLLMGCPIQTCPEKVATANPITWITADDPPFLIVQGMLDCLVPYKQSLMLHDALIARGLDSKLVLIPNGEHGGRAFDEAKYKQMVDEFLDQKLRGPIVKRRRAVGRR
ncbi:MAG TPA: prolyl oligopeptidase family serine peptidase, partial [Thermoanaerobaculia bacterium]